jgi:hypothetical protein
MPKQNKISHKLSKSRYTRGLQCHKSLWLLTHSPELRTEPDASLQSRYDEGHVVGELAQELFPGGVMIPFDGLSFDEQIRLTAQAMQSAKVIYEAAFSHNGVFVKADIMRKGRQGWDIYEVKSSTDIKDVHLNDIAVQYHVIGNSGIKVGKAFLVHLNNKYVRSGPLGLDLLFTINDVTADPMKRQPDVKKEIVRQQKMLKGKEPGIDIGPHCEYPYDCDFMDHCWRHIPEDSVFDLRDRGVDKYDLYRQGIVRQCDIPLELLNAKQRQQVEATLKKKNTINNVKVREFLDKLWYPLCFLDFETFQSAVPPYDGTSPYQQIPFQYSLHYRKRKGGKLYHCEYLAQPGVDPRKELIDRLLEDVPDGACIVAYNKAFEIGQLKELAKQFPCKRSKIQAIIVAVFDLMYPFKKRHIYSWKQSGSYSLKTVLPTFVKGMTYDGMEIGDGGAAMEAYHVMGELADKPKELAKLRTALLTYCRQDTLAMVKLLEILERKIAG